MNVRQDIVPQVKVPPNAPELEQAVLGALMLTKQAFEDVSDFLDRDHFYQEQHRLIYDAIVELFAMGVQPDMMTVTDRLKVNDTLARAGGPFYVSTLTNRVASTANVQSHARIIVQKYMTRSLIQLGGLLTQIDDTNDPFDILEEVNEVVGKINSITSNGDPSKASQVIARMVDNRERPLQIALGLPGLDECVSMAPGNVCIVGARPAVGKTAVALTTVRSVAMSAHNVAFISLEMSETQLMARMMATLTGIDSNRITINDLDDIDRDKMARAAVEHGAWIDRLLLDDRAILKSSEVFGLFARLKKRHGCEVVIVDYMQMMEGDGSTPVAEMTNISKRLKQAAKASGIRLIALSQLKRRPGADIDPVMDDLRESGQIEADGDMIILLGRAKGSEMITAKLEKHKFGPLGTFEIPYDLSTQTIGARVRPPEFRPQIPASVLRSFTEPTRLEDEQVPF